MAMQLVANALYSVAKLKPYVRATFPGKTAFRVVEVRDADGAVQGARLYWDEAAMGAPAPTVEEVEAWSLDPLQSLASAYQSQLDPPEASRTIKIRKLRALTAAAITLARHGTANITNEQRATIMAEGAAFYEQHAAAIVAYQQGAGGKFLADVQAQAAANPEHWLNLPYGDGAIVDLFAPALA